MHTLCYYHCSQLLRTCTLYVLCLSIAFATVAVAEKQAGIGVSIPIQGWLLLWMGSLSVYSSLFLPLGWYASIISNYNRWASTREYLMFMALGWSDTRRQCSTVLHALCLGLLLWAMQGYWVPWVLQQQVVLGQSLVRAHAQPKIPRGQFSRVRLGKQWVIAYRAKQPSKSGAPEIFIAAPEGDKQKLLWLNQIKLASGANPGLELAQGKSYIFSEGKLEHKLRFAKWHIALPSLTANDGTDPLLWDNNQLWSSTSTSAHELWWWRLNYVVMLLGLTAAACILTAHKQCHLYPNMVAIKAGLFFLLYSFFLLAARTQISADGRYWYYLIAHALAILALAVLVRIEQPES